MPLPQRDLLQMCKIPCTVRVPALLLELVPFRELPHLDSTRRQLRNPKYGLPGTPHTVQMQSQVGMEATGLMITFILTLTKKEKGRVPWQYPTNIFPIVHTEKNGIPKIWLNLILLTRGI